MTLIAAILQKNSGNKRGFYRTLRINSGMQKQCEKAFLEIVVVVVVVEQEGEGREGGGGGG